MSRRSIITLLITSVAFFMVTLDNLIVHDGLPSIRDELGALAGGAGVDGQRLHAGIRRLPAHRRRARRPVRPAPDVPRRHRAVHRASAVAALAPSTEALIAARAVQGFGARDRRPADADADRATPFPAEKRGLALGIWSGDQRPRRRPRPAGRRRDHRGHLAGSGSSGSTCRSGSCCSRSRARADRRAAVRAASSTCAASRWRPPACSASCSAWYAATSRGWTSPTVIASLIGGAVLLVAFLLWERRAATPMLPLRFSASRAFAVTNACRSRCPSASSARSSCSPSSSRPCGLRPARGRACARCRGPAMPMLIAPIAGAAVRPHRVAAADGRRPDAAGDRDRWIAMVSEVDVAYMSSSRPSCSAAPAWRWCSRRRPTPSSARSGRTRPARPPVPTTPSASSAACSASRCSRRCSARAAATQSAQAFVDGLARRAAGRRGGAGGRRGLRAAGARQGAREGTGRRANRWRCPLSGARRNPTYRGPLRRAAPRGGAATARVPSVRRSSPGYSSRWKWNAVIRSPCRK